MRRPLPREPHPAKRPINGFVGAPEDDMTLRSKGPVLDSLRTMFRGEVIGPDDRGYDIARKVHNGMIDKRPAVIARCSAI